MNILINKHDYFAKACDCKDLKRGMLLFIVERDDIIIVCVRVCFLILSDFYRMTNPILQMLHYCIGLQSDNQDINRTGHPIVIG